MLMKVFFPLSHEPFSPPHDNGCNKIF